MYKLFINKLNKNEIYTLHDDATFEIKYDAFVLLTLKHIVRRDFFLIKSD